MRASLFGLLFAVMAVIFWDDVTFRHIHILLANIWWAAAYIAFRLESRA